MANEIKITISIDTEGKTSIAYDTSETASLDIMGPLDPEALSDLATRTPVEVDQVSEPALPAELLISTAPEADIAPKIHDMDKLPSLSRSAIDEIPGPSILQEYPPGAELTTEYPQVGDQEIMIAPTPTAELPEPPHLMDPLPLTTSDNIPGPMSFDELSDLESDPEYLEG